MSISAATSLQSTFSQIQQNFSKLQSSLKSNDLKGVKAAFSDLQKLQQRQGSSGASGT